LQPRRIVVTGASGQVGRALVASLVRLGQRPVALVREPVALAGCDVVADWMRSDEARAALARAEAIVHLAGTLQPAGGDYEGANVATAARVARALDPAIARRLVLASSVGASEASPNAYLATKARAERVLRDTGVPLTVLRCTHVLGEPREPGPMAAHLLAGVRGGVLVLGSGRQRVAPVLVNDVVAAIEGALERELDGTHELQGPEEMSLDELVRLLNVRRQVRVTHVPAPLARLLRFVGPRLPAALIDVLLADSRGQAPASPETFGYCPTPVSRAWTWIR